MNVNKSFTIPTVSYIMVHELRRLLEDAPDGAIVTVSTHKGDRNEMDYHSMPISWTERV